MSLSAKGIRWNRAGRTVLDDVGFESYPGQTIGLLGPNGSGKSSLLRVLAGISRPDAGEVLVDGADLHSLPRRQLARRLAMVDQQVHTEVDIMVADVVRLGRIPHRGLFGGDPRADDRAVDAALANTGMTEHRRRMWHTLSGGERQRAQIARALAQEPTELLLDEPTNHLDISHQLEILSLVAELPVTSYIALHDLNLAAMFCDRVLVLQRGAVAAWGHPSEVITEQLVQSVYDVSATVAAVDDGYPVVTYRRRRR
ncbi:ABC transporter ATP-binding protein [Rhodococcus sp. NPDC058521]|uniref:ABC transporter ATP-binding protein n=1 Tax=Rhodococcus sp. NPDC058521 TaxID=3346536 RepID=UPI00365947F3